MKRFWMVIPATFIVIVLSGCGGGGTNLIPAPIVYEKDFQEAFKMADDAYWFYDGREYCGKHAQKMLAMAQDAGYKARLFYTATKDLTDTHMLTEVWIESLDKWILFDATFDLYYTVNGSPANGYEMHNAFVSNNRDAMGYIKYNPEGDRVERFVVTTNLDIMSFFIAACYWIPPYWRIQIWDEYSVRRKFCQSETDCIEDYIYGINTATSTSLCEEKD